MSGLPCHFRPSTCHLDRRERSHAAIIRSGQGILGSMRFLASLRNDSRGASWPLPYREHRALSPRPTPAVISTARERSQTGRAQISCREKQNFSLVTKCNIQLSCIFEISPICRINSPMAVSRFNLFLRISRSSVMTMTSSKNLSTGCFRCRRIFRAPR